MDSRQLFVLRHAKSSWEHPGQDDRERPLAPRGRRAAKLLAEHLAAAEIVPAQVLCSPARRTLETYEGVGPAGELVVEPGLYAASGTELLQRLRGIPSGTPSVMVIGHNPAAQSLVLRLAGPPPRDAGMVSPSAELAEIARKFPTGALASLEFSCSWAELDRGCARLTGFIRPRSLA